MLISLLLKTTEYKLDYCESQSEVFFRQPKTRYPFFEILNRARLEFSSKYFYWTSFIFLVHIYPKLIITFFTLVFYTN